MAIDGLSLKSVVSELQQTIIGGKLQKSYQPQKDEIILQIYNKKNYRLLINCNAENYRLHLTSHTSPNPLQAPLFCMLLRKHLDNGRIIKIEQPDLERVVKIYISSRDELGNPIEKVLIAELMGKHSNIILAHAANHKIIDAVKRVPYGVSSVRQILPGFSYQLPPTTKSSIFEHEIIDLPDNDLETTLVKTFTGISPLMARELVFRKHTYPNIIRYVTEMVANCDYQPSITTSESGKQWCGVLPYTHLSAKYKQFASINEALDHYFMNKNMAKNLRNAKQGLTKIINKVLTKNKRTLSKQQKELSAAQKADRYKRNADLIKANLYQIKPNVDQVTVVDYYHPEMPRITIKLDPQLSPSKNLTTLYKKYEKALRAQENLEKRIDKNSKEITYLESLLALVDTSLQVSDVDQIKEELIEEGYYQPPKSLKGRKNPKQNQESWPRRYISADNFIIEVGRNNRQNDHLTLKKADKEDCWLHAKDIPGAHVVIRNKGAKLPDTTLLQAANLAAYFSKASKSANVPVDYTTVKRVFKQRGAHPGQVLYTHQKTIYVTPDASLLPESADRDGLTS